MSAEVEEREVEVVREEEEEKDEEAKEDEDEDEGVTAGASTVSGGRMDVAVVVVAIKGPEELTGEPGGEEAGDESGDSDDDSRGTRAALRGEERGSSSLTQLSLCPLAADMGRKGWEIRWMRERWLDGMKDPVSRSEHSGVCHQIQAIVQNGKVFS